MEVTHEIKRIKSQLTTSISVLEKRREAKVERNDERDMFQVY
jgi:hypothetical protein